MKGKPTGRPPLNKEPVLFRFKVEREFRDAVRVIAARMGMTQTDYIRRAVSEQMRRDERQRVVA